MQSLYHIVDRIRSEQVLMTPKRFMEPYLTIGILWSKFGSRDLYLAVLEG